MNRKLKKEILKLLDEMWSLALDTHKNLKDNEKLIFKAKPKDNGVHIYSTVVKN
jgi:hypothetical protein